MELHLINAYSQNKKKCDANVETEHKKLCYAKQLQIFF